jgi:hypothetical protein
VCGLDVSAVNAFRFNPTYTSAVELGKAWQMFPATSSMDMGCPAAPWPGTNTPPSSGPGA